MLEKHRSLVAWQRADDLYLRMHRLSKARFPVEGFSRSHRRERVQFLQIAWGSLQEVAYCLHAARRLDFIDEETANEEQNLLKEVAAPLAGLMRSERQALARETDRTQR